MFTAIDALEFPELHDESIPFMAFLKQLTKLMKAAGVRDFMMQARTPVHNVVYMPQPRWWTLRPGSCLLQSALENCEVLCMQDICKPDPARLRRNLSAVINFAKFREEKLGRFMEMQEAAEALLERNAELEQQKRSLVRATLVGFLMDLAYFCLVCMWP